ncbi:MAG: response regulator [Devosiaceae bacterium]|nr:response regulator [Devosiaceae bacterium MH13]
MRRIMRMLLHGLGMRSIQEAEDGAVALDLFTQTSPDLVVTDWVMPVFDGIELTRAIRNQSSSVNPYTPIIMVSAFSERSRVIRARDSGINEFLVKPVSARELFLRVENCVISPRPFVKTQTFFGPDRRRFVHPNYTGPRKREGETSDEEHEEAADAAAS